MSKGYWNLVLDSRVRRRRLLASAGGAGAAALLLAACGGDDEDESGTTATTGGSSSTGAAGIGSTGAATQPTPAPTAEPGLLYMPLDATERTPAGPSGTLTGLANNIQAFDTLGNASDSAAAAHSYSRLVKAAVYKYPETAIPSVEGDAATSWERSPDGLTYTFNLRPNFKYDPRPPTNGRALNAEDVMFSWARFVELNRFAAYLAADADPSAPVASVTAPDAQTLVFSLNYPYSAFLPFLTWHRVLAVLPVEAESEFDVKLDSRGTAAWRLKEYLGSSHVTFVPNPDWYDADKIKFNEVTYYDLPDYTAQLAQFVSGKIAISGNFSQEDVLTTKQSKPELLMKQADRFKINQELIRFSYLPDSPFLDERVRRAVSMLLDRDLIIETLNNSQKFQDAGLDVELRWSTVLPPGEPWWMDPKGGEFGPTASAFFYEPAEAKKLLAAAGHTSPIKVPFALQTEAQPTYEREGEIMAQMLSEHGDFEAEYQLIDYRAEWRPNYQFGKDMHPGMAYGFFRGGFPDADIPLQFFQRHSSDQGGHVAANGQPDETLESLLKKQQGETDFDARLAIMKELQRYCAEKMYTVPGAGDSTRFELGQPWLANWGVYRTYLGTDGSPANEVYPFYFLDNA